MPHKPSGIDSIRYVSPLTLLETGNSSAGLGFPLEQIDADALVLAGLTGRGVKIGIIDGGFLKANRSAALGAAINSGQPKAFRNFMQPSDSQPFAGLMAFEDTHGTDVWELTGGHDTLKGIRFGLATGADYYLARTDHGGREPGRKRIF